MKKELLKSKTQWIGLFSSIALGSISLMILFSDYFYLAILTLYPLIYISWKAPYAWIFSKNQLVTKTIFKTQKYNYTDIKLVELIYPNARIGLILTFKLKNGKTFSIDYQDKYWTEDLCNILLKERVQVKNKDFDWLKLKEDYYEVENFYPRNNSEVKRKRFIFNQYL